MIEERVTDRKCYDTMAYERVTDTDVTQVQEDLNIIYYICD